MDTQWNKSSQAPRPPDPVKPDSTLFGYQVVAFLGEGAAATVYAVTHPQTGQLFALKHVIRRDEKHQRFIDQLSNELEISRRISHPGVRKSVELKIRKGTLVRPFEAGLVMELLDAEPLDARMHVEPLPTAEQRVQILLLTARAGAAINEAGYVHCDIKPGNIMLCADRTIRVIDLGQACPNHTIKPRVQGSPHYISPEQYRLKTITFATDVFNFGATAYWLMTSRHIPTSYTRAKGLAEGSSETCTPPHELNPQCPEELSKLICQSIRLDPRERPADMREVAARIASAARGFGSASAVA